MKDEVERIESALSAVVDPELGVSVVDLGLVYGIDASGGRVHIRLTMTTPACPLGEDIVRDARERVEALGLGPADVELVWEPPWTPARMRPSARAALGWEAAAPTRTEGLVPLRIPERAG